MMVEYLNSRVKKDLFPMFPQLVIEYQVFLWIVFPLKQSEFLKNPFLVRYITRGNVMHFLPGLFRQKLPEL